MNFRRCSISGRISAAMIASEPLNFSFPSPLDRATGRERGDLVDAAPLQPHVARHFIQPPALADRDRAALRPHRAHSCCRSYIHFDLERGIEPRIDRAVPDLAEAAAFRTPAVRRIEGEQPRVEFLERLPATRATHFRGDDVRNVARVQDARRSAPDLERALQQFLHAGR